MSGKHSVIEWLARYYHFVLMNTEAGSHALEYLLDRSISEETIKEFQLGYSPKKVRPTLGFLKGKGFSFNDLVDAKILIRYQNGKYKGKLSDPFRGRITIPIKNHLGKTVAFGGRTLDKNNKVKYINSPETSEFIKGDNIFGFSLAKQEIKNLGFAILFEGYFDAITAYQSGIKNSVATLGTALTVNQALLIKSITENVVIAFDGDQAGMEASFKSASILESVGCNVRIAHIDNELDPDDYIKKHGKDKFIKEVVLSAKPVLNSLVAFKKKEHNLTSPNDRYVFASEIINSLVTNDVNEVQNVLKLLETTLGIPSNDLYGKIKGGV